MESRVIFHIRLLPFCKFCRDGCLPPKAFRCGRVVLPVVLSRGDEMCHVLSIRKLKTHLTDAALFLSFSQNGRLIFEVADEGGGGHGASKQFSTICKFLSGVVIHDLFSDNDGPAIDSRTERQDLEVDSFFLIWRSCFYCGNGFPICVGMRSVVGRFNVFEGGQVEV